MVQGLRWQIWPLFWVTGLYIIHIVCLLGTSVKKKYGQLNIAGHLYKWTSAFLRNEVIKI